MKDKDAMGISLTVTGQPPSKNTSYSTFNEEHEHPNRVIALLSEVKQTLKDTQWDPREQRQVGISLVIVEPPTGFLGDAMNYLGGVAEDAREVRFAGRGNADLSYLGDLAKAALYFDDYQIREVHYSVESGDTLGYRVRVWVL